MDENTLEPTIYVWIVNLGDWMVPFRVLEYNLGIFQPFKKRDIIILVLEKEEKTLEMKKSEEQEENIPYIYKSLSNF